MKSSSLSDDQISLLIDEHALKQNILRSMERIYAQADSNDIVIFYFSGHGSQTGLLPYDWDGVYNNLYHSEIKKIFDRCLAKGKICIVDACHSGSLLNRARSAELSDILESYYTAFSSTTGGIALMMSSMSNETSIEIARVRQGVFSFYVINGLIGQADANGNRIITISELYEYVAQNVKKYTRNRQNPVLSGNFDKNLPIGVVRYHP